MQVDTFLTAMQPIVKQWAQKFFSRFCIVPKSHIREDVIVNDIYAATMGFLREHVQEQIYDDSEDSDDDDDMNLEAEQSHDAFEYAILSRFRYYISTADEHAQIQDIWDICTGMQACYLKTSIIAFLTRHLGYERGLYQILVDFVGSGYKVVSGLMVHDDRILTL